MQIIVLRISVNVKVLFAFITFVIMKLRIKEVAKLKGEDLQDLAKKIGISRQALNARMTGNPSMEKIQDIADALGVTVFELIEPDSETYQSYDQEGNWRGVLKK